MSMAFLFPGQGSQSVGMLSELGAAEPRVRETFEEASQVLGYDLWKLCQEGPASDLDATDRTQPAMLAAGVAVWRVWEARGGPSPDALAGHSLGEYSALVAGGALAFPDAVALVAFRARAMQEAVPAGDGAMAAILGLDDETVRGLCAEAAGQGVVEAVNFNAPGQVVIAGDTEAVERAVTAAKEAGAKRALPLPVSVPSHCALMRPAAERLAQRLADTEFAEPRVPVLHNVDVQAHADAEAIREALTRQLHNPVRWVETIQALDERGVERYVECGPGKVLAGLNRRIDRGAETFPVFDPASLDAALAAMEST